MERFSEADAHGETDKPLASARMVNRAPIPVLASLCRRNGNSPAVLGPVEIEALIRFTAAWDASSAGITGGGWREKVDGSRGRGDGGIVARLDAAEYMRVALRLVPTGSRELIERLWGP